MIKGGDHLHKAVHFYHYDLLLVQGLTPTRTINALWGPIKKKKEKKRRKGEKKGLHNPSRPRLTRSQTTIEACLHGDYFRRASRFHLIPLIPSSA